MAEKSGFVWEAEIVEKSLQEWAIVLSSNSEGSKPGESFCLCLSDLLKLNLGKFNKFYISLMDFFWDWYFTKDEIAILHFQYIGVL